MLLLRIYHSHKQSFTFKCCRHISVSYLLFLQYSRQKFLLYSFTNFHLCLQIIMMYNKNVTDVTYRIDPAINKIDVTKSLTEKLEEWSTSVCPHWSRVAVTPYKVEVISHERKKRSVENSEGRNQKMHRMKRFEIEWVLKA